jgi:hypothetical protein
VTLFSRYVENYPLPPVHRGELVKAARVFLGRAGVIVTHAAGKLHLVAALVFLMFFLGLRTATENNAQRTDNSSLPQLYCRLGLQRGREPDTAHNFFGHFETSSGRCGRRCLSIASSVDRMPLPARIGAYQ